MGQSAQSGVWAPPSDQHQPRGRARTRRRRPRSARGRGRRGRGARRRSVVRIKRERDQQRHGRRRKQQQHRHQHDLRRDREAGAGGELRPRHERVGGDQRQRRAPASRWRSAGASSASATARDQEAEGERAVGELLAREQALGRGAMRAPSRRRWAPGLISVWAGIGLGHALTTHLVGPPPSRLEMYGPKIGPGSSRCDRRSHADEATYLPDPFRHRGGRCCRAGACGDGECRPPVPVGGPVPELSDEPGVLEVARPHELHARPRRRVRVGLRPHVHRRRQDRLRQRVLVRARHGRQELGADPAAAAPSRPARSAWASTSRPSASSPSAPASRCCRC